MSDNKLTLTAADRAELDALAAQAADPAAWARWERQAAQHETWQRTARSLGRELPDGGQAMEAGDL